MSRYVKLDDLLEYLKSLRMNREVNASPHMDAALLNIQQLLELDAHNPCLFDAVEIGGCDGCRWQGRHQKCSCCRRNRGMKDCYEEGTR